MSRYKERYTLFKRGNYWYYRTYDNKGVRTTAHTTGQKSKGAAKQYCDELFLEGNLNKSRITFKQYAEHFFDDESVYLMDRTNPLSPGSLRHYRQILKLYLIPNFGNKLLADIDFPAVKNLRATLIQSVSVHYAKAVCVILKIILSSAVQDNLIKYNPAAELNSLRETRKQKDSFTKNEIKILWDKYPRYSWLIVLMSLCGMRTSEARGTTKEDVIELNGISYVHLTRQLGEDGNYAPLKSKSDKSLERYIPILPVLIPYIRDKAVKFENISRDLRPTIRSFENWEKRGLSSYSLRHFFITDSKSYGITESKVETIVGHSLKGITEVYTNYHPEDLTDILKWQLEIYNFLTSKDEVKND